MAFVQVLVEPEGNIWKKTTFPIKNAVKYDTRIWPFLNRRLRLLHCFRKNFKNMNEKYENSNTYEAIYIYIHKEYKVDNLIFCKRSAKQMQSSINTFQPNTTQCEERKSV